jgi:hypothetical protein
MQDKDKTKKVWVNNIQRLKYLLVDNLVIKLKKNCLLFFNLISALSFIE